MPKICITITKLLHQNSFNLKRFTNKCLPSKKECKWTFYRLFFFSKNANKVEPRQLLRIQRKKLPNGLIKLELRYVSYQVSISHFANIDLESRNTAGWSRNRFCRTPSSQSRFASQFAQHKNLSANCKDSISIPLPSRVVSDAKKL